MSYSLGKKSKQKLEGVHEDIVAVVELAISKSEYDFTILEGLRSVERQKELVDTGKSTTMNSRHLNGHAVDIAPWPISWDWDDYYPIAKVIKEAAEELDVDFEWGGDWKTFPDAPHWQLSWRKYP
jgi:peptidoglycan L-alanyl-D-glutamate endopeptidase CwlK